MIALCHDKLGCKEYGDYFKGEIYLDSEKGFFKALGNGQVRRLGLWALLTPAFVRNYQRAKAKGIQGNTQGDGQTLGGLLVVAKGRVVYEFKERMFGDHAPIEQVLEACKEASKGDDRCQGN